MVAQNGQVSQDKSIINVTVTDQENNAEKGKIKKIIIRLHHLDSSISKDEWTKDEESKLLALHAFIGKKLSELASHFPGR